MTPCPCPAAPEFGAAPPPAGGTAPADATYLTLSVNALLTQERVFTPTTGLLAVDGGAGLAYTLSSTTWGKAAAVVSLVTVTDQVGIGTATPIAARKLHVLATGTNVGVRSEVALSTDTALDTFVTADTVARLVVTGDGNLRWSSGGAVADIQLYRSSVNVLTIDNGAGSTASLRGAGDTTLFLGSNILRMGGISSVSYAAYLAAGDVQPAYSLTTLGIFGGPGGAAVVDARLRRTAAAVWTIDNTAGGAATLLNGADNLGSLGTATVRWAGIAMGTTTGINWYAASADANPVVKIATATAGIQFGPGGASAPDSALRWVSANILEILATTFRPAADNALTLGSTALRFANAIAVQFNVYTAASDANASASVTAGTLRLGAGGATALDTRITRSAATTLTVDDGAAGAVNVFPGADNVGQIGDATHRWALVRATTITSGDLCFDDDACPKCGREFAEKDELTMFVLRREPDGDTKRMLTRCVPAHARCGGA